MEIVNRLVAINNGQLDLRDEDFEVMKEAAILIDVMGMNYYQSRFIQYYDGENDIHHNGTGEKGTSRFCLKNVGRRMEKKVFQN